MNGWKGPSTAASSGGPSDHPKGRLTDRMPVALISPHPMEPCTLTSGSRIQNGVATQRAIVHRPVFTNSETVLRADKSDDAFLPVQNTGHPVAHCEDLDDDDRRWVEDATLADRVTGSDPPPRPKEVETFLCSATVRAISSLKKGPGSIRTRTDDRGKLENHSRTSPIPHAHASRYVRSTRNGSQHV